MRPPVEKAMPRMPGSQGLKAWATTSASAALPGALWDNLQLADALLIALARQLKCDSMIRDLGQYPRRYRKF